jgi:nucleoside-diphosphate-sugar epimerase
LHKRRHRHHGSASERISTRLGYNLNGLSFSAAHLADVVRDRSPGFSVTYEPDFRQAIADSWPDSMDDSRATQDWGWEAEWSLERLADDMFTRLRRRKETGQL